jgi:predicted O-methyltransferase YrrM
MYRLRTALDFYQMSIRTRDIDGWLDDMQGYVLSLMAEQGPGVGEIVEIGSFKGKSTCWLAYGAKSAGREKVTAIDPFTGSPEHLHGEVLSDPDLEELGSTLPIFEENLRKLNLFDYVVPIVALSAAAAAVWNRPIRLLFIDGDHSYEGAKQDFELWSPHVVPGGLIALHDIGHWEGVTRFYRELMSGTTHYEEVLELFGLVVLEKKSEDGAR